MIIGNENTMKAEKIGKLRYSVHQLDGNEFEVALENVKFVPDQWIDLFSPGGGQTRPRPRTCQRHHLDPAAVARGRT